MKNGIALIYLLIIIAVIVAIGIGAIVLITKNINSDGNAEIGTNKKQNIANTNSGVEIDVPEKVLYQPNEYKQVYIDKNGKLYNLDEIIDGKITNNDFSYGTGVVEKDGKYAIMDYTGKIIVEYGKYDYIADLGMNYAACGEEGEYILLDINGNIIDGIRYENIDNMGKEGIYVSEENIATTNWKKGIITCSGSIVAEPSENFETEGSASNENIIFQRMNDDWFVISKKDYKVKFSISGSNIAQDYYSTNSLIDLEKNIVYVFDDTGDINIKLTDCLIKDCPYWDGYKSYYSGLNIKNKLSEYGYLIYECADGKYGVVYKDGTTITKDISLREEIFSKSPDYYIGEDYIFVQVGTNVEVYNGSKKVITLENRKIIPEDELLKYFRRGSDKIIPILNNDDECVYLYNEKGELINNKKYGYPSSVLETIDGSEKIKLTPDGKLLDVKEFTEIDLLYNEELGEYANNYFIGLVETEIDSIRTEKKYYLINDKGEKLFETRDATFTTLYEKDNILIYNKGINDDINRVYDLKNNTEILALEEKIEYISEYKVFISNNNIYSLTGELIGNY